MENKNRVEWVLECGESSRKEHRCCGYICIRGASEVLEKIEKKLNQEIDCFLTYNAENLIIEKLYATDESDVEEVDSYLENIVEKAISEVQK